MKRLALFLMVFLAGCTSPCNAPYFEFKSGDCCVDTNSDRICDIDQKEQLEQESAKNEALSKLEEAKKAVEGGGQVSLSNLTSALTDKTCWTKYCSAAFDPSMSGKTETECSNETTGVSCITDNDCYEFISRSGASSEEIAQMIEDESIWCQ